MIEFRAPSTYDYKEHLKIQNQSVAIFYNAYALGEKILLKVHGGMQLHTLLK